MAIPWYNHPVLNCSAVSDAVSVWLTSQWMRMEFMQSITVRTPIYPLRRSGLKASCDKEPWHPLRRYSKWMTRFFLGPVGPLGLRLLAVFVKLETEISAETHHKRAVLSTARVY